MNDCKIPYFLGGALAIEQGEGYRAGLDAVLLAASVQVPSGKTALELGCGAATALLCAAWYNPQVRLYGVEKQPDLVELARNNVLRNQLAVRVQVEKADICDLTSLHKPDSIDHVFFNPPFQDHPQQGTIPAKGRDTAFITDAAGLSTWIDQAVMVVKTKGYITLIHRAERLADILELLNPTCGDIHILPIAPRAGDQAHRVLVRGRKGSRSPASLCAPLLLHETKARYTSRAEAILQGKQALVF